ncbi:MAG TPA: ANTAR domain-containing protein [Solirubrobacteraceae bacterium]|nr:ANTAR domain-containing protein [Solirubrobacteraceae bacterium]
MASATRGEERQATERLHVLVADEDHGALQPTVELLRGLGHDVVGRALTLGQVEAQISAEQPDMAVVRVHHDDEHALELIAEITEVAGRPVIAIVDDPPPAFVRRAAERGIFAYAQPDAAGDLQGAIEVAMQRYYETVELTRQVDRLESALERRAVIERAKGILMERHGKDDTAAFGMLREQARRSNRTVIDLSRAIIDGHPLLPKRT